MSRRRFSVVALITLAVSSAWFVPTAGAVQSKPRTSTSYYVNTTNTTTAYNDGCSQGQADAGSPIQSSEVILDFGGQNSGNTGSILINGTVVTFAQIKAYAEQFGAGYYFCTGADTTSVLSLAIGTNNSAYQVSNGGGQTWANSVVGPVKSWLSTNGYASQVTAIAGNDMEPSWAAVSGTRAWVDGYSGTGKGKILNYGSADGCPTGSYSNGVCNNGWHQSDVWYVSWGNASAFGLPEIYYIAQSQQWTMISRYGYFSQGGTVYYDGPLTQYPGGGYTAAQSWTQFWTDLNSASSTAQSLTYSSNI
jgi:hypothetical protein